MLSRAAITRRVATLAVVFGGAVAGSAALNTALADPAHSPQVPDCYADFINDNETDVSRALMGGADTLYYMVAPALSERVGTWVDDAMAQLDRIVAFDVVRGGGEPQIRIRLGRTQGHAGLTTSEGDILLPQRIEANTSDGRPRGPRTIAQEIGHAVGLSHLGHDETGMRPDDWNTAARHAGGAQRWRGGMITHSDTRVVRLDGKTPLDDRDTVMAFLTHAESLNQPGFRWMDVLALQRMYGAGGAETGVRRPSGGSGSCNAKT